MVVSFLLFFKMHFLPDYIYTEDISILLNLKKWALFLKNFFKKKEREEGKASLKTIIFQGNLGKFILVSSEDQ